MCVIIIKNNHERLDEAMIAKCLTLNPDGFGIQLLDDGTIYRTMDMATAQEYLRTSRPYVAHARLRTAGTTSLQNTHPVQINEFNWLFHNGTVCTPHTWDKSKSDTRFVAETLRSTNWRSWRSILEMTESRFCYTRVSKSGKYYINRTGQWHRDGNILYSKANVLEGGKNLVAVYGTLRQGFHNHHLLQDSMLLAPGETNESYRMVCDGIPYVLPGDTPEGHRLYVEVYAVDDETLARLDQLEGHPDWYYREPVRISLANHLQVTADLYFNPSANDNGVYFKDYADYRDPIAPTTHIRSIFDDEPQDDDFIFDSEEGKYYNLVTGEYIDDPRQQKLF